MSIKWLVPLFLIACTQPAPICPPPPVCTQPRVTIYWSEDFKLNRNDVVGCLYKAADHSAVCMSKAEFDTRMTEQEIESLMAPPDVDAGLESTP